MPLFTLLTLLAFIEALVVCALLTPLARRLGPRLGMIDRPNEARKIHSAPIPRSGGLAIFAGFWGCLALNLILAATVLPQVITLPDQAKTLIANFPHRLPQLLGLFLGSLIIFVLGAIDDARNLPAKLRLVVQILAVVPLLLTGTVIKLFLPIWLGYVVTIFWIVLLTNSFNFLDNMNGLTSGVAVIIGLVMALQSWMAREYYMMVMFALLAGSVWGFWFFNFPRASIFLGDSGSTHLGFLFGGLTAISTYYDPAVPSQLSVLMPVVVLGVPLFDTLSVMWIRWRSGKPLMEGDKNHFSHRMVELGMSRVEAVVFIYGVTLCVGLAAVVLRPLDWRYGLLQTAVIAMMFLAIYWMERVSYHRRNNEG